MPLYCVEALERLVFRTYYYVSAESAEEAERLCREGAVGCDEKSIVDGDEDWIKTVSIELSQLNDD